LTSPTEVPEPTVVVGKITKAHGLHGEVVVLVISDNPDRFSPGASVFLENGRELGIRATRPNGGRLLVSFEGVNDRNAADLLRGSSLVVPLSMLPELPEGDYWPHQLIGCHVVTEIGRSLGTVADVIGSPASDLWAAVDDAGEETLIPAIREVVMSVDVVGRRIEVREIPGLTAPDP
jgi:16S rRNA processing protein RimM